MPRNWGDICWGNRGGIGGGRSIYPFRNYGRICGSRPLWFVCLEPPMRAVAARDRATGVSGLPLTERPYPHAAENDVIVRVHAAGFIAGELDWYGTWVDRAGHAGPVRHGRLASGETVLIHGSAGAVGSIAVQLAREAGARVIGTGRASARDTALRLGAHAFLDLQADPLEDAGEVDVVFHMIGGDVLARSAALVRAGGTLVTRRRTARGPAEGRPGGPLRRGTRPRPARRPRPAGAGRTAQAERRDGTDAGRSAGGVHSRAAHPRQDDHSCHRGPMRRAS